VEGRLRQHSGLDPTDEQVTFVLYLFLYVFLFEIWRFESCDRYWNGYWW
jgi:hypothetical protein